MKIRHFFSHLDEKRIVESIARAETQTSGEIRVFVSHREIADPMEHAKTRFLKLGMDKTRERNAVLIYFAPRSQGFAVVGDVAIHNRCGDTFWQSLPSPMSDLLKQNQFTEAIILAVEQCGKLLAKHFPRPPGEEGPNELPNAVGFD